MASLHTPTTKTSLMSRRNGAEGFAQEPQHFEQARGRRGRRDRGATPAANGGDLLCFLYSMCRVRRGPFAEREPPVSNLIPWTMHGLLLIYEALHHWRRL